MTNGKVASEETREFKNDINKRINKIEEKIEDSTKEIFSLKKDIRALERYNGLLTSALVSAFVTIISCVLLHWKGL